jgi:hypothetical protein
MDLQDLLIAIYVRGPFSTVFHSYIEDYLFENLGLGEVIEIDLFILRRIIVVVLHHCWMVLGWRPTLNGVMIVDGGVHTHAAMA